MTTPPRPGPAPRATDLRLAGFAGGVWLCALACLYLPARTGLLFAAGAGAAAASTWWAARRHGGPATVRACSGVAVAVLLGTVCGAVATAARVAVRDAPALGRLARAHAGVQALIELDDDPHPVRSAAPGPATYAVAATLREVTPTAGGRLRLSADVLVLATDPGWRTLLPGTRVAAAGRLSTARGGDLRAAVLSVAGAPRVVGAPPWVQTAAGTLRAGLRRACAPLPRAPGGLLPGLVLGDTTTLDPAVEADFRTTGLTHLVAVSGANLAIVGGLVLGLARWCRAGPRTAAGLSTLAVLGFVILARPSPSVLRAAAMGAVGLIALASGRTRAAVPALGAAAAVLVVADPALAGDAGFALSVSATAGLLLLAPGWRDRLVRHRVPVGLAEALAVPAAAHLACAPVIAAVSGTVGLATVPANLLAEPAVAPATVLGVAAAAVSPLWPAAAAVLAWSASWPARWLVTVARYGATVPATVVPWPAGTGGGLLLAAVLGTGLVLARRRLVRLVAAVLAAAAVLGAVPVAVLAAGWPPPDTLIVMCDVGQGDAIVVPDRPGHAVVVDAGPEPVGTDRCLRQLGVAAVDLLVLTHFHADHVGGLDGVYRARTVAGIVTSPYPQPAGGRAQVLSRAAAAGTPVGVPGPGWTWQAGTVRLSLLGPVHPLGGTDSDPNNNSLVLLALVSGRRILLAGDAQAEEQADVLKVAHHGSAKQDPRFLDAVAPAVALVSAGLHNDYGLPNLALLDRLQHAGARVLRTDVSGDVAVVRDHDRLAVVVHGVVPGRPP